jgi:hypothetical protein
LRAGELAADLFTFALNIPDDAAQPGAQLPDLTLHAAAMFGVRE